MEIQFDIEAVENIITYLKTNQNDLEKQKGILSAEAQTILSAWEGKSADAFSLGLNDSIQEYDHDNKIYLNYIDVLEMVKDNYLKSKDKVIEISKQLYQNCLYNMDFVNSKYSAPYQFDSPKVVTIPNDWIGVFHNYQSKLNEQADKIRAVWKDGDESYLINILAQIDYCFKKIIRVCNYRTSTGLDDLGQITLYQVEIKEKSKIDIDLDEITESGQSLNGIKDGLDRSGFKELMNMLGSQFYSTEDCSFAAKCVEFAVEILEKCCNYIDSVYSLYSDTADAVGRDIFDSTLLNDESWIFNSKKWQKYTEDEKTSAIESLINALAVGLNISNVPTLEILDNIGGTGKTTIAAQYDPGTNKLLVHRSELNKSSQSMIDHIAHEMRHCWQMQRIKNPQNDFDSELKKDYDNFIEPEDDYDGYMNQIMERDAREYSATIQNEFLDLWNSNNAA